MKQFRRLLFIVLAALAVSVALVPLGWTPWADHIRTNAQRRAERPRPIEPRKPALSANQAPPRSTRDHVPRRLMFSLLQMGVPGCLTVLVLTTVQRRRRRKA